MRRKPEASLASIAISLVLLAGYGFYRMESSEDKERKQGLIDQISAVSMQNCSIPDRSDQIAEYRADLEEALSWNYSSVLDFMIANQITICLDERLDNTGELFAYKVRAMYYPSYEQPVYTMSYDGDEADYYTASLMETFAGLYSDDPGAISNGFNEAAYTYRRSCGESCTTRVYKWDTAEEFKGIQHHPELNTPPVTHRPRRGESPASW